MRWGRAGGVTSLLARGGGRGGGGADDELVTRPDSTQWPACPACLLCHIHILLRPWLHSGGLGEGGGGDNALWFFWVDIHHTSDLSLNGRK